MNFASDNWAGAAPEILAALIEANEGLQPAYGGDAQTARVSALFSEIFERDVAVFLVPTGGAANGLALSAVVPRHGAVLCHEEAHIQLDECAGPEFFTGGAKLVPLKGFAAKLTPETVREALAKYPARRPHGAPFAALSITQASECGAVYRPAEIAALAKVAQGAGLALHVDGARFANAVAALGVAPADLSWRAGVDILSFGATKNGCIAAEAVVFFDPKRAGEFDWLRKRAGHLVSKHRFLAAQFEAYFRDGLWLRLARHANAMAQRLSSGLAGVSGVEIVYPTEANAVFATFPEAMRQRLLEKGAVFYPWVTPGDPAGGRAQRLICSFRTTAEEVDSFIANARGD